MNLLKIISIIGISTIVNLFSGFLKGKIMAVYFGSGCLGIWSQATNLFMIGSIISLFGLNQGLIRQIAARDGDSNTGSFIYDTLAKSMTFSLANSLIIASVILLAVNRVSAFFFDRNLSPQMITFIAIFLPFQVIGDILGVFLLASKEIKKFTLANILISIFGLSAFIVFTIFFGLRGAYLSVGIYGMVTFFCYYFISKPLIKGGLIGLFALRRYSRYGNFVKNTLNFGALRLVQVIINPLNMLLIRSLIIKKIGLVENGFFDALTRISIFYTPFITNILWSYTFPIYCGIKDNQRFGSEINKFIRLSLILFVPVCVAIMLFGSAFVCLLFSKDFLPIVSLLSLWFLVDLLRVTSWPINIVLIAQDKMRLAVLLEFLWNAVMLLSAYLLIGRYSLRGVIFSYILAFSLFLLANYVVMKRNRIFQFQAKTFFVFCISLVLIFVCARPGKALLDYAAIVSLSLAFFLIVMDKQEKLLIKDALKKALVRNF